MGIAAIGGRSRRRSHGGDCDYRLARRDHGLCLGGEEGGNATRFVNWTNLKIMRLSQSSSEKKIDRLTLRGARLELFFVFSP